MAGNPYSVHCHPSQDVLWRHWTFSPRSLLPHNKRVIIRSLLGAARLTTSECSSQSRRQASLPPVLLLIRSILFQSNILHYIY